MHANQATSVENGSKIAFSMRIRHVLSLAEFLDKWVACLTSHSARFLFSLFHGSLLAVFPGWL
jgi:hypothetical protein